MTRTAEHTITGQNTHVATIGGKYWPAWEYDAEHVIVDLRLFPPPGMGATALTFRPDALRAAGVPEDVITAAGNCEPIQGFCIMPRTKKGRADHAQI